MRGRGFRRGIGMAGLLLASWTAAEEPRADAPTGGGLSGARTEYEAIKAATVGEAQQKLSMPKVPTLDLKTDEPRPLLPSDLERRRKQTEQLRAKGGPKSANWLLEAMEEPKRDAAANAKPAPDAELVGEADLGAGDFLQQARRLEREDARRKEKRTEAMEPPARADAVNPLTAFMASWMTAGDFDLLRPAGCLDDSRPPENGPAGPNVGPTGAAGLLPADRMNDALSTRPGVDADLTNPYLAPLPALPLPEPAQLSLASPPPAAPPVTPPAAAPARAATAAEEFRKTQDDDKYFRQLKRF